MASSDDEEETFADTVSDYYFCDGDDEPLSFSKLPLQLNDGESDNSSPTTEAIFLRGNADNGLQKLYKAVKAWKYDFSNFRPEISVLSKDNHWIKLQKPRKSFENEIRSILITVNCLSYLKRNPEASAKSLWDHLSKVFSLYDVRPSENDLRDHMKFIRDAVDRDEPLAKSKFLVAFLENPRKRKVSEEAETATKPSFIVDDTVDVPQDDDFVTEDKENSESDEEADHFDSVCAICDNGGTLTCCDGKCFRSFHANPNSEEAEDSNCKSLGLTPDQVKRTEQFCCENCTYYLHQCFVCNKLGNSNKSSGEAEVFRCSSATCGHFYHPKCVAKLLQPKDEAERNDLLQKIGAGEPFICPAHKCDVCKQTENEKVKDLQFAVCRRCPKSYHRKCLPRDIMFESQADDDDDIVRAWDNLLAKSRALIYCTNHDIDEELCTPVRTLIYLNVRQSYKDQSSKPPLKKKKKTLIKETGTESEYKTKKPVMKLQKKSLSTKMEDSSSKKRAAVPISSTSVPLKKKKVTDTSKNPLRRTLSEKVKVSSNEGQPSLGNRLFDLYKGTESNNMEKDDMSVDDSKQTMAAKPVQKEFLSPIDEDSKERILKLMKDAASSITLDEVKKYHTEKVPSTHKSSSRVEKSIILARVEGSVEALHLALKKLEEGCSLEDAMAICEPRVLHQMLKWKDKLRVYLAPFLHGMRYTSFGRHFTKVEKLEKIVDKLKYYVEDGDTVVDFCCGANDFSTLMKKHLDEMGKKKCSYKNYDFTRPKNDFNFEKRDWMSVSPKELPSGSNLIMGLNPPFGKNAALANKFVQQALGFMPKLIVLIVPPETERLDSEKQKCPYDLVWEDDELLSGKSFYFPGSIDVNEKQIDQWNNTTPFLYLWSRPDWTNKHKTIAQQHGHIPGQQQPPPAPARSDENLPGPSLSNANSDMEVDPTVPLDDVALIKKDPEQNKDKSKSNTNTNTKRAKKASPKKKQIPREKPSNQNSTKRNHNIQETKTEKHEDKHVAVPSRQDQTQKVEDKHSPVPSLQKDVKRSPVSSREEKPKKTEVKHSPGPAHENRPRETVVSDANEVSQRVDQHVERRYNPAPTSEAPLDYSSRGQSVNQHLERRYNTNTPHEEPYRRPDAATPSYSMRPDPAVQYHNAQGYERVNRGSYYDEMGGSRYHEPGLNRYGGHPDVVPYNSRTSTSTMQRYAPRLDELNHTTRMSNNQMDDMNHSRMGNFGRPEPPPPPMGNRGGYGPPPMHGPGFGTEPMGSLGFAPGPYNPYHHHNSSGGWLNE